MVLDWRAVTVNIHEISSSEIYLQCLNVIRGAFIEGEGKWEWKGTDSPRR